MSETLALALVTGATGLGGVFLGAFAAVRLERRRERRRGAALRQAVRADLMRWITVCRAAAGDFALEAKPRPGIDWWSVAGEIALHLPPGLYALTFMVYANREKSEWALKRAVAGWNDTSEWTSIRVSLHRWALLAEDVLSREEAYFGRTRWERIRDRHYLDHEGKEAEEKVLSDALAEVARRLRDIGYDVDDEGSLRADIERLERDKRAKEDVVRRGSEEGVER